MAMSKKISAVLIFAIIIIDIMVGLVRNVAVVLAAYGSPTDASGAVEVICAVIEPSVAVIVCSLPAYGVLVFKFRSRQRNRLEFQHTAAADGKWWQSQKLLLLIASIPGPQLEISILKERPIQATEHGSDETTEHGSEEILVEAPGAADVEEGEVEK